MKRSKIVGMLGILILCTVFFTSCKSIDESCIGEHEAMGMAGFYEAFGFQYPRLVTFMTTGDADKLTQQEKDEVIKILASFRVE